MSEFNQQKYIREFNKQNYDKITIQVKKGYRDKFKKILENKGLSMAQFIMKTVDEAEKNI